MCRAEGERGMDEFRAGNRPNKNEDWRKDMEEFKAANRTYTRNDWKREKRQAYIRKAEQTPSFSKPSPPPASLTQQQQQPSSHYDRYNSKDYNNSTGSTTPWSFGHPEVKRQQRVARYKAYGVEGKMKSSLKNGLRWAKNKYCQIVYGY
ncbi:hypothetical protein Tsubulata_032779 [Turnera subulata]|uniref:Uncharacterized protein n=1 Tax=Turnera subulata TaxID=218843 RepID=A0A9Q0GEX9_9ROSI|nr:hypothetical protein Tsubulata_032779 [Turnera subulata]